MNTPYTFKRSLRARRLRITIYPTGDVTVTAPRLTPMFLVNRFLASREKWVEKKVAEFRARPVVPITRLMGTGGRREFNSRKHEAHEIAVEKVHYFANKYDLKYGRISIRNQKTRWGSCSKRGNLSFNYRIVFLPTELQDYLVVHELCHLKEFNHSQAFWRLVEREVPGYKALRKRLKGIDR